MEKALVNISRENFLDRVRQAVSTGNRPGAGVTIEPRGQTGFQGAAVDQVQHFRDQFTSVGGFFHLVADGASCLQKILEVLRAKSAKRILLAGGKLLSQLNLGGHLKDFGFEVISVDRLTPETCSEAFFTADIGLSGVEYLVAETGTLVLQTNPDEPRSISLLPPIHVAIAERKKIVDDLFDLFESSDGKVVQAMPSCITFVTGPSKTGDIELRLVTGVHGPGEIHLILMNG
jgi:L-lactate utilization protein LutC